MTTPIKWNKKGQVVLSATEWLTEVYELVYYSAPCSYTNSDGAAEKLALLFWGFTEDLSSTPTAPV